MTKLHLLIAFAAGLSTGIGLTAYACRDKPDPLFDEFIEEINVALDVINDPPHSFYHLQRAHNVMSFREVVGIK